MSDFITKDSGARASFKSGMQRDLSVDKPRFDLILPKGMPYKEQLFTRWAELMGRGAKKYNERNWEKASGEEEYNRFKESAFRHFMQWFTGEEDEDHAVAILFNIQGAEFVKWKMEKK